MTDVIYLVVIAELLFVCVLSGYFVFKLRQRLRRLARKLNPAAFSGQAPVPDMSIASYMVGQTKLTRALPDTEDFDQLAISSLVTTVRCAYLMAERRALKLPLNSREYWLSLRDDIGRMIGLMSMEAKRAGVENVELREKIRLLTERLEKLGDKRWLTKQSGLNQAGAEGYLLRFGRSVDEARSRAGKSGELSQELSRKIGQQKDSIGNLGRLVEQRDRESQLELQIAEYERLLYKMEHESSALQKSLKDAHQRLLSVDDRYFSGANRVERGAEVLSIIRSGDTGPAADKKFLEDLINDSRDIVVQSRGNIDDLQKTIFEQRKSILFMENSIGKLESQLDGSQEGRAERKAEIDALRRALSESEDCIKVLESEVDSLYQSMHELQNQSAQFDRQLQESAHAPLAAPAVAAGQDVGASQSGTEDNDGRGDVFLSRFMADAIECGSLEDLVTVLQQSVSGLGYQSIIRIQVGTANVEVSNLGKLGRAELELLDQGGEESVALRADKVLVGLRNLKAVLVRKAGAGQPVEGDEAMLGMLFRFSSGLAQKVCAQQSVNRRLGEYEYIGDMMHKISASLEVQYNYQKVETQSIIQSILDQSSMLVGEHPTGAQQMVLDAMQKEVGQRVQLLDANRSAARRQFVKIMEKLKAGSSA